MLVVDTPFPPYKPVEVSLGGFPDVGETETATYHPSEGYWLWYSEGILHRDGDLPAVVNETTGHEFFKAGVRHRINGYARILRGKHWTQEKTVKGDFFLYGLRLYEERFHKVNRWAIQHSIPLWVAVVAEIHSINLDEMDSTLLLGDLDFNKLPVSWVLKTLGIVATESYWDTTQKRHKPFSLFVSEMERVIACEVEEVAHVNR